MRAFSLHPQLAADSHEILSTPHCALRLMEDARYLWLLLIPLHPDCREWHNLPPAMAHTVLDELRAVSQWAERHAEADKMNIGALGNMVPQLHIHIIARHMTDFAWPKPVWGLGTPQPYSDAERQHIIEAGRSALDFLVSV